MRCLNCHYNGIKVAEVVCPRCTAHLRSLMRDVLIPGTLLEGGKYRLDYPIGRGGFGITYRAIQVKFERHVAIKEFFPREHVERQEVTGNLLIPTARKQEYEKALTHFLQEGRLLSMLNHQNVVRVIDFFEEKDTAYLVMQLIDGCTLRDKLDELPGKRLPEAEVKSITAQLVSALEAIHKNGIYHLDISPDNVQLTSGDDAVLIDFGAARQELSTKTDRAFKLEYAAPEVLAGKMVGERSDLFELAMMVHELLTGSPPPSVLARLAGAQLELGQLAEPWRSLLTSALHMEMNMRPASVREWWDGFARHRDNLVLPSPRRSPSRKRVQLPRIARTAEPLVNKGIPMSYGKAAQIGSRSVVRNKEGQGRPTEKPVRDTKWRSRFDIALKLLGCIVFSCLLGFIAYLLAYNLMKPDLKGSPGGSQAVQEQQAQPQEVNPGADTAGAAVQYDRVSALGIFAFFAVALGTFVLLGGRLLAGGENDDRGH